MKKISWWLTLTRCILCELLTGLLFYLLVVLIHNSRSDYLNGYIMLVTILYLVIIGIIIGCILLVIDFFNKYTLKSSIRMMIGGVIMLLIGAYLTKQNYAIDQLYSPETINLRYYVNAFIGLVVIVLQGVLTGWFAQWIPNKPS
jgi:predicted permease